MVSARRRYIVLYLTLLLMTSTVALLPAYPRIAAIRHDDPIYRQQQNGVEEFYRNGGDGSALVVYRYRLERESSLISLAARFGLPYSALASLNRLDAADPLPEEILVPSMPGLFIAAEPESDTEQVLAARRAGEYGEAQPVTISRDGGGEQFYFLPGRDFDRVERLSYLGILFRRPVRDTAISSFYGYRLHPVTGRRSFHSGVDFPGPTGTAVFAAREGTVIARGNHPVYGLYVRLGHAGGYETFYGHLDEVSVELNQRISSGMMLGTIGNTGLSTGPHLHFEIRLNGESRDPVRHLPGLEE